VRRLISLTGHRDEPGQPVTWLCARHIADLLVGRAWVAPPGMATFEYRAARESLALTSLLTSTDAPLWQDAWDQLREMQALLAHDVEWALWCSSQLTRAPAKLSMADVDAAFSAWSWLARSRLLGGGLFHCRGACVGTEARPGAGVSVGVVIARRTLRNVLEARRGDKVA
jgi:hypothetical protein